MAGSAAAACTAVARMVVGAAKDPEGSEVEEMVPMGAVATVAMEVVRQAVASRVAEEDISATARAAEATLVAQTAATTGVVEVKVVVCSAAHSAVMRAREWQCTPHRPTALHGWSSAQQRPLHAR